MFAVFGCTGTGKSQLAVEIANALKEREGRQCEIINMDSMQVYQGFPIATNIPTEEEMQRIPHHQFAFLPPTAQEYNVRDYVQSVGSLIDTIVQRGHIPILAGGTHYYLFSLFFKDDVADKKTLSTPEDDPNAHGFQDLSADALYDTLKQIDPIMAEKLHPNDHRKIKLSLGHYYSTGQRYSDLVLQKKERQTRWPCCFLWVDAEVQVLEDRLNRRVDKMMARGLIDELNRLVLEFSRAGLDLDFTQGLLQSIGGKEFEQYLFLAFPLVRVSPTHYKFDRSQEMDLEQELAQRWENNATELQSAVDAGAELLKIKTRQYACKQRTWVQNKILTNTSLFQIPASDIADWRKSISEPAIAVAKQFLVDQSTQTLEDHPWFVCQKKRESCSLLENWKKYECDICKKIVNGKKEWAAHVKSKAHRRAKKHAKVNNTQDNL